MGRPKTDKERSVIIARIIELVKEHGHMTTAQAIALFGLHRTTAEKYLRDAIERGGLVRHGRCGIFRDQRATIDFDMKRFSHTKTQPEAQQIHASAVQGRGENGVRP